MCILTQSTYVRIYCVRKSLENFLGHISFVQQPLQPPKYLYTYHYTYICTFAYVYVTVYKTTKCIHI